MDKANIILGGKGFLGSYLQNYFKNIPGATFQSFYKPSFDICDITTYGQLPINKELFIFDTINVNNGNKLEIEKVNVEGQKTFVDWLNKNNTRYHYIYFSTLSTLKISKHLANDYIVSKYNAECYVKKNCKNYTIIRLTFLFGKGENNKRLISRIINNLKSGQDINIDDVYLNLTPVEELQMVLKNNEFLQYREINFTDGIAYRLQDLVSIIINKLRPSSGKINFTNKKIDLTFSQNFFSDGYTFKVKEALEKMIEEG